MKRSGQISTVFFILSLSAGVNGAEVDLGKENGDKLPAPFATPSVINHPKVVGWSADGRPTAPDGFRVNAFARQIDNPRWIYVLPHGDVLVVQSRTLPKPSETGEEQTPAEREKSAKHAEGMRKSKTVTGDSPDLITLLRDQDGDGEAETRETLLEGLHQPFGMALVGKTLFVANTDGLLAFDYDQGSPRIAGAGRKIVDLPAGGYNNHWTRNVVANADGSKLYISVGSASNVGEQGMELERQRANILEVNPDGSDLRVYASGLRNPVGLAWAQETGELWTVVN